MNQWLPVQVRILGVGLQHLRPLTTCPRSASRACSGTAHRLTSLSRSLSLCACGRADPAEQVPAGQKLAIMGVIVLVFSMAEVYFGMAMSSVTLVADGFHNLADAGGFGIAVFANWAQAHARDAGHLTHRTKEQKVERIGLIGGFTNCSITLILTFAAGGDIYIYTNSTLSTYSRTLTVINLLNLLNLLYICILTHTHTHTHTRT